MNNTTPRLYRVKPETGESVDVTAYDVMDAMTQFAVSHHFDNGDVEIPKIKSVSAIADNAVKDYLESLAGKLNFAIKDEKE